MSKASEWVKGCGVHVLGGTSAGSVVFTVEKGDSNRPRPVMKVAMHRSAGNGTVLLEPEAALALAAWIYATFSDHP